MSRKREKFDLIAEYKICPHYESKDVEEEQIVDEASHANPFVMKGTCNSCGKSWYSGQL